MEYLEDACPEVPLRPAGPVSRARMRLWQKWPDDGLHVACGTLSYACAFADQVKSGHDRDALEQRLAKLPDVAAVMRRRGIEDRGQ